MFHFQHGGSPQLSFLHRSARSNLYEYFARALSQRKKVFTAGLLVINLFFQLFDGMLSHYVLAQNVPELNPLVNWMIQTWGHAPGLVITKGCAIALIIFVFSMRRRQPTLIILGLSLTAAVYGLHTLFWSGELLPLG